MLPSRGCCHGVFLLCHAARLKKRSSLADWTCAARDRATFMSRALDLEEIAIRLLDLKLVAVEGDVILADSLEGLSERADVSTLRAIAHILLKAAPPTWLWSAVHEGEIATEYVPASDLQNLAWLGTGLDELLLDVYASLVKPNNERFLKAMGDAAELVVMAALRKMGNHPLHVALLSDSYGYDIECLGSNTDRIEVKAASEKSMDRFHITRNEYEKSTRYGHEWRLVQVVFSRDAFLAARIDASHVKLVRELNHGALQELVPKDTTGFKWTSTAQIFPPESAWYPADLSLDPAFSITGFSFDE